MTEYEGDATDAKTTWTGVVRDEDGTYTLDASADGATESDTKTFTVTLTDAGAVNLGTKLVGDIEELARQGETAAADAPAE